MWVSSIFTVAGGILVLVVLYLALRSAVRAASPEIWATHYPRETYVSFAWREIGRGLFLGYLFALGFSPLSTLFLIGQERFWESFGLLSLIVWGFGASIVYGLQLLPGLWGYVRHQRGNGAQTGINLSIQVLIVMVITGLLAWVFVTFLMPPALVFFRSVYNYLHDNWQLLTRISQN